MGDTGDYTAHLLRSAHPKHASVKKQFLASWEKQSSGIPTVERKWYQSFLLIVSILIDFPLSGIYWIRVRPEILEMFELSKLQNQNVKRLFHGTGQSPNCFFGTGEIYLD